MGRDLSEFFANDVLAVLVEVEIRAIVAERRLNCVREGRRVQLRTGLANGEETQEEERRYADGERRRPAQDRLELERQEEQVWCVSGTRVFCAQIVTACSRWNLYASGRAAGVKAVRTARTHESK